MLNNPSVAHSANCKDPVLYHYEKLQHLHVHAHTHTHTQHFFFNKSFLQEGASPHLQSWSTHRQPINIHFIRVFIFHDPVHQTLMQSWFYTFVFLVQSHVWIESFTYKSLSRIFTTAPKAARLFMTSTSAHSLWLSKRFWMDCSMWEDVISGAKWFHRAKKPAESRQWAKHQRFLSLSLSLSLSLAFSLRTWHSGCHATLKYV